MDILTQEETSLAFRCDKDTLNEKLSIAFRAAPPKATLSTRHSTRSDIKIQGCESLLFVIEY